MFACEKKTMQFTRLRAEEFYDDHANKPYYDALIQYMMRYSLLVLKFATSSTLFVLSSQIRVMKRLEKLI